MRSGQRLYVLKMEYGHEADTCGMCHDHHTCSHMRVHKRRGINDCYLCIHNNGISHNARSDMVSPC